MELYQLNYFREIARQRHFTRAAASLNVAQPALSQQIQNLEAELGTLLFVRGRKQTHLTPAGEAFLPCAEAMLAKAEAAKQAVAEVTQLRGGRLILATIPSVSECWLPDIIGRFRKRFPMVELVLLEDTSERVAELVETDRAELGFLLLPLKSGRPLEVRKLVTEPFVLLVPATCTIAQQKSVCLTEVAREPMIFYKGRVRDAAFAACREAGFNPRIACESSELETIRSLVRAGLGLAIIPKLAARELPKGVVAITLRAPRITRTIGLISRRKHEWSTAGKEFAAMASLPSNFDE
jgi:LysR family hydrogen peroxide-inducible transcriptional activator